MCMYVCYMHAYCPRWSKRDIRCLRTEVTGVYRLPCGVQVLKLGFMQEQRGS